MEWVPWAPMFLWMPKVRRRHFPSVFKFVGGRGMKMVNILIRKKIKKKKRKEKYWKWMHGGGGKSKENKQKKRHLEHPIDITVVKRQARAAGVLWRRWAALTGSVLRWQVARHPVQGRFCILYRESSLPRVSASPRGTGLLTVSAGLGKWCGVHKGVKL